MLTETLLKVSKLSKGSMEQQNPPAMKISLHRLSASLNLKRAKEEAY